MYIQFYCIILIFYLWLSVEYCCGIYLKANKILVEKKNIFQKALEKLIDK
jgi:hypothetical protein